MPEDCTPLENELRAAAPEPGGFVARAVEPLPKNRLAGVRGHSLTATEYNAGESLLRNHVEMTILPVL